ncbi:Bug family tripartite tricarboxylate transporter substrate binding protein [Variovorax soli]|uniref:Bug family tripartite tricarboxylate transporter substrate binding protein n=1 Tax=Variovorax soli TaxID=376815 RepID=UPI0008391FFA|nr:tripartite tricarboxylate transporter substrate binding protein [Variovorax soli]
MNKRSLLAAAVAATFLAAAAAPAAAQDFPTKPVRIVTPFPVGSGPDGVVRLLADKLSRAWSQPVTVENRPGGNGFIAIDAFKRGAKDGYDLIQLDNVHLVAYPYLFKKLPYDPVKDFEQIDPLFRNYFFVSVSNESKYKTVGQIIADAKANPGKLNYGSWSIGNPVHLGSALLESMTGTKMEHIVYKETTQLYSGVATNELSFALGSIGSTQAMQRSGKLRYIAVAGPRRNAAFPDVPTVAESGGPAGYEVIGWTTLAAPPGLPKAVTDKIRRDVEKALADNDFKAKFEAFGYEPFPTTPEKFDQFMQSEARRMSDVIKSAKVSLD